MKIGIFHPTINICGGAEWVAINIINSVKGANHETVVLTNELINQGRVLSFFGRRVNVDSQIVFPLEFFPSADTHNIYTNFLRGLILKSKCDLLIDTYTNGSLPGSSIAYIHYPLSGRIPQPRNKNDVITKLKKTYFALYSGYERKEIKKNKRLFLANSTYTRNAIKKFSGADSILLYPPVTSEFHGNVDNRERTDTVVSVGRFSPEKRFTLIPQIAKLTGKHIHFIIVGINESVQELRKIRELIAVNNVSNRVKIITDMPREQLVSVLRSSKVFLNTSANEHFGIAVVEAMASGCITITHNSCGPREFVPEQFRFDSIEEAAEIIDKAITEWSPKVAAEFTSYAQQFSEENFSKRFTETFNSYLNKL